MAPFEGTLVRNLRRNLRLEGFCPGSCLGTGRGMSLGWSWLYRGEGGDAMRLEGKALSIQHTPDR